MAPAAVALVLAAAVCHALWNRLLHTTGDRVAAMAVGSLGGGLLLAPATFLHPPVAVLPLVVFSALAEAAYGLCLAAAYRRGALSVAYPLGRGTAPLLVTLGGWVVLAQRPGVVALLGTAVLAIGMALLAGAGRRAGQGGAVRFALLTGAMIATYQVIDARAVRDTSPPGYLGAVLLLTGLFLTLCLAAAPRASGRGSRRLRDALLPGLGVAAGSTAAYLLVLLAFRLADAGRVSTLREASVLIGVALAGERPGRAVWVGAACVVTGAVLAAA
jgi:drug/metabolite transporter (DMT)-like permease